MSKRSIVHMKDITMSFSGNLVLNKVSFELHEGEVHALMGANGAGKSTLIKILNGIYSAVSGSIFIDGEEVSIKNPSDAEKHGLAFVHQELNVCMDLTVAENMYIGNWARNKMGIYDKKETSRKAKELLIMMGVDLDPDMPLRKLRTAEKQIIEILKTMTKEARVIILDEPTSSLNEKEKENFFRIIDKVKQKGVSIIFISHFLEDVMQLSDRVTVLRDGIISAVFERDFYTKDELITAMMGKKVENIYKNRISVEVDAPTILEVRNLTSNRKFQDVSFSIQKGDIIGVCGLLGAGKTEIARAIFGLDDFDSGEIVLCGEKIKKPKPHNMIAKKVALLTEERKLEGFIPLLSIRENTTISILKTLINKLGVIDKKEQSKSALEMAKQMMVKMSNVEQSVVSLSGGNQQKVVIAKCLAINPVLFLLDEPTRGVDVYAKSEIYNILRESADNGTSVIIFSSELEELLENCSKILVVKKGQLTGIVNAGETSKNQLLSLIG